MPPSTNIAVIGSGIIGRTLATRFAQAGHAVAFGSRTPDHPDLTVFTLAFERGWGRSLGFRLLTR